MNNELELELRGDRGKGSSINDVTQNFHIHGPLPPCHCPIHATYQYYCHVVNIPLPLLVRDVIYGWFRRAKRHPLSCSLLFSGRQGSFHREC